MATIIGSDFSETLDGTSSGDTISGRGGDDTIYGRGGHDLLDGGTGDDFLYGGSGNDDLIGGSGVNDLWGDAGYDYFVVSARAGAALSDDLVWDFEFDVDQVDLRDWGVSDFSQVLALLETDSYGDATLNAFYAGRDHRLTLDDVATGDLVADDFVFANPGALDAVGTAADDVMFGSRLEDSLSGGDGRDILLGGLGRDVLSGGTGDDDLVGGIGNDIAYGGTGSDLVQGDAASDLLYGEAGRDFLYGGSGNDQLRGGTGTDDLNGGTGADRFVFEDGEFGGTTRATADYIADFSRAEGDLIDVRLVDAIAGGGDQAFAFIGGRGFSGHAGELRATRSNGDTFVWGDVDGDGRADFMIYLEGTHTLSAGDFLL
jgi:Ca2+-binding RTX toxin-like protein